MLEGVRLTAVIGPRHEPLALSQILLYQLLMNLDMTHNNVELNSRLAALEEPFKIGEQYSFPYHREWYTAQTIVSYVRSSTT